MPFLQQPILSQMRKEIGINLSNMTISEQQSETPLQKTTLQFYHRKGITKVCLYTNQMVENPDNKSERVPACYRLSSLASLSSSPIQILAKHVHATSVSNLNQSWKLILATSQKTKV